VSAGSIQVVFEDDSRHEAIEQVDPAERGDALAELGLWYDAYDFFAGHSRAHPELTRLEQQRDRMMAMARISP
jgi:hypothetical protein